MLCPIPSLDLGLLSFYFGLFILCRNAAGCRNFSIAFQKPRRNGGAGKRFILIQSLLYMNCQDLVLA